jgi:hypothetical protein
MYWPGEIYVFVLFCKTNGFSLADAMGGAPTNDIFSFLKKR